MVNIDEQLSHHSSFIIRNSSLPSEPAYKTAGRENALGVPRLFHLAHDLEVVARRTPDVNAAFEFVREHFRNQRTSHVDGKRAQFPKQPYGRFDPGIKATLE